MYRYIPLYIEFISFALKNIYIMLTEKFYYKITYSGMFLVLWQMSGSFSIL